MPNALPRSFGSVNVVVSSDSADGTSSAANAPWQARAMISMAKFTEAPPMADTPANPARPARNVTFRPNRSASPPPCADDCSIDQAALPKNLSYFAEPEAPTEINTLSHQNALAHLTHGRDPH